jgi:CTP synthase (UTP-ammonia lyase)
VRRVTGVRIGIVGDFDPTFVAHTSQNDALAHAGASVGLPIEVTWLPTPSLAGADAPDVLSGFDGLWISAGSPYQDRTGAWAAIRFARERGCPLVAT